MRAAPPQRRPPAQQHRIERVGSGRRDQQEVAKVQLKSKERRNFAASDDHDDAGERRDDESARSDADQRRSRDRHQQRPLAGARRCRRCACHDAIAPRRTRCTPAPPQHNRAVLRGRSVLDSALTRFRSVPGTGVISTGARDSVRSGEIVSLPPTTRFLHARLSALGRNDSSLVALHPVPCQSTLARRGGPAAVGIDLVSIRVQPVAAQRPQCRAGTRPYGPTKSNSARYSGQSSPHDRPCGGLPTWDSPGATRDLAGTRSRTSGYPGGRFGRYPRFSGMFRPNADFVGPHGTRPARCSTSILVVATGSCTRSTR